MLLVTFSEAFLADLVKIWFSSLVILVIVEPSTYQLNKEEC